MPEDQDGVSDRRFLSQPHGSGASYVGKRERKLERRPLGHLRRRSANLNRIVWTGGRG